MPDHILAQYEPRRHWKGKTWLFYIWVKKRTECLSHVIDPSMLSGFTSLQDPNGLMGQPIQVSCVALRTQCGSIFRGCKTSYLHTTSRGRTFTTSKAPMNFPRVFPTFLASSSRFFSFLASSSLFLRSSSALCLPQLQIIQASRHPGTQRCC